MYTGDAPVEELMACRLASAAHGLAAALVALEPAERRHARAIDRWYARWAADVREHQELVEVYVLPRLADLDGLDDGRLAAIADEHAWIDELVGDLGDAIGILAFNLGEPELWLDRARALAGCLAERLTADAERLAELSTGLDEGLRRALARRSTGVVSWVNRFRPDPLAALAS